VADVKNGLLTATVIFDRDCDNDNDGNEYNKSITFFLTFSRYPSKQMVRLCL